MKEIMKIYDNGGKSFDRYSVVFLDQPEYRKGTYVCLGMSENPRTGFGQHCTAIPGRHLGKRIVYDVLPTECKDVLNDLYPEYFMEVGR